MHWKKVRGIEERLESVEQRLANAKEYLARNINVEGSGWLHFDDWRGKSGHPSWMKNHMIPVTMKYRAKKERALRSIASKAKDKYVTRRRRGTTT